MIKGHDSPSRQEPSLRSPRTEPSENKIKATTKTVWAGVGKAMTRRRGEKQTMRQTRETEKQLTRQVVDEKQNYAKTT